VQRHGINNPAVAMWKLEEDWVTSTIEDMNMNVHYGGMYDKRGGWLVLQKSG
jgi:hypothetical protein